MDSIKNTFTSSKALITYITAGDPDIDTTEKLVYELEKNGADIIELGIPFSDSLADGPTIVESHMRALQKDTTLHQTFKLVKNIRKRKNIPIVFMLSYNLVYQFGIDNFVSKCDDTCVSGYIIPDLPFEETPELLKPIYLIAPTTPEDRIKQIVSKSSGFIYLVSTTGVTGARNKISSKLNNSIKLVKKYSRLPIAIGFGISTPEQARMVSNLSDGVIVGSALVKLVKDDINKAMELVQNLKKAIV